ncbi:type II toxin-antitoxin system Phd/YefM family antitoxin [Nocardiopsis sp. NPDC050513]|uniref:type II toxin-antitoxin system Phd/YefM family antitoxin n=1 Tax=Nocardiopsis sp. NPDC050513 TaxID=3364338 RepID=UPI0037B0027D
MRKIPLSEAAQHLPELLDQVEETGEPVTITRDGEPSAAVVPAQCYESLSGALRPAGG